jgi:hypothetical protein
MNFTCEGSAVDAWYSNGISVPLAIQAPLPGGLNLTYLNILPLIVGIREQTNEVARAQIITVLQNILKNRVGLSDFIQETRNFYLKNTSPIQIEGQIRLSTFNLIFPIGTLLPEHDVVGLGEIEVSGSVTLQPMGFGFTKLGISGDVKITRNGTIISEFQSVSMNTLAKTHQVSGNGSLAFPAFYSGFPYSIHASNSEYSYYGKFQFQLISFCPNSFLIYPESLNGF